MTTAGRRHSRFRRNERWSPISGAALSSEPAPAPPVTAATEDQQHDEKDQKGCRVHVVLLWTREPSWGSLRRL